MGLVAENSSLLFTRSLLVKKDGRRRGTTMAKKTDLPKSRLKSQRFLAQSAIGVFGLGFIDAGYSGDWSRIGVISKESETLLKLGAFIVLPLCFFLVFNLSKTKEN